MSEFDEYEKVSIGTQALHTHIAKLEREKAELRTENGRMAKRLEIDHVTDLDGNVKPVTKSGKDSESIDGISCRDETIDAQDRTIERLRTEINSAVEILRPASENKFCLSVATAARDAMSAIEKWKGIALASNTEITRSRAEVERMRPVVEILPIMLKRKCLMKNTKATWYSTRINAEELKQIQEALSKYEAKDKP